MRRSNRRTAPRTLLLLAGIACQPWESAPVSEAGAAAAAVRDTTGDRAAVAAMIDAHWAAINSNDTVAVKNHHTADMTLFGPESKERVTLAAATPATTALWEKFRGSTPNWTPRDVQIRLVGDVGIATYYNDGSTRWADGTVDGESRKITEIWVRQADGSWKEAHHHDSRVSQ